MSNLEAGIIFYEGELSEDIVDKCKKASYSPFDYIVMLVQEYQKFLICNKESNKTNGEEK